MNKLNYIKNIQMLIEKSNNDYDAYKGEVLEFKNYLENEIIAKPNNVSAICFLASAYNELRYDGEDVVKLLKDFINTYEKDLDNIELARIYTNLAYYLSDEFYIDKKRALELLEEAIKYSECFPQTFTMLGLNYYNEKNYVLANKYFKKAYKLDNSKRYKYNYAISLIYIEKYEEALFLLENIDVEKDYEANKCFAVGLCKFYLGNKKDVLEIADKLFDDEMNRYGFEVEISEMYFLCDEYEKYLKCYDDIDCFYFDEKTMLLYLYALKQLGKTEKIKQRFRYIISKKIEEIEQFVIEDEDDEDYFEVLLDEKRKLLGTYKKIIGGFIPKVECIPVYMYGCNLIDCVIHSDVSN